MNPRSGVKYIRPCDSNQDQERTKEIANAAVLFCSDRWRWYRARALDHHHRLIVRVMMWRVCECCRPAQSETETEQCLAAARPASMRSTGIFLRLQFNALCRSRLKNRGRYKAASRLPSRRRRPVRPLPPVGPDGQARGERLRSIVNMMQYGVWGTGGHRAVSLGCRLGCWVGQNTVDMKSLLNI